MAGWTGFNGVEFFFSMEKIDGQQDAEEEQ